MEDIKIGNYSPAVFNGNGVNKQSGAVDFGKVMKDAINNVNNLEKDSKRTRAVLGLFDVSARPFVPATVLTFSVPMNKFLRMINNMEESFLITDSWKRVQKRIGLREGDT
jgi:hypothetical protein